MRSIDLINADQTEQTIKSDKIKIDEPISYGSAIYRAQPFPSDIDLIQYIYYQLNKPFKKDNNEYNEGIKLFEAIIQNINDKVGKELINYKGDFKAGINHQYDAKLGKWKNNKLEGYDESDVKRVIHLMHKNRLIDKKEHDKLMSSAGNLTYDNWDYVNEEIRKAKTIRWRYSEIEAGHKKPNGKKLFDALKDKTNVKYDIWSFINGKYVEVTNMFIFVMLDPKSSTTSSTSGNGTKHYVNMRDDFEEHRPEELREDIEKLFISKIYFKPFKMVKRMWALAHMTNDKAMLKKLTPLTSSTISLAGQVSSEIETLIMMLEKLASPPLEHIRQHIDTFKPRLANVTAFRIAEKYIFNVLDDMADGVYEVNDMIKLLKEIKDYLKEKISDYTIDYLKGVNLWPPPRDYLPETLQLDIK